MKEIDITNEIRQLHLEEQVEKLAEEVKEELKHGSPQSLKDELKELLRNCKKPEGNIIKFPGPVSRCLAEIELLAAASKQDVGDLVSQPLVCLSKGFSVDIRRVLGSDNEVTLYFEPVDNGEDQMEEVFAPYSGQTISMEFALNGALLLSAYIYVDESARQAEGEGVLTGAEIDMKNPKITINVNAGE